MENLAHPVEQVKRELVAAFSSRVDYLFQLADKDSSNRLLEEETWKALLPVGASTLSALFAIEAQGITERDLAQRGLSPSDVHMRTDKNYWAEMTTTFGKVSFPLHAYREIGKNGSSTTHNPAKEVLFPAYKHCRSSTLCLEWETCLGSDHPFRTAQESLKYFSHGAVSLEDNTIARHMVRIGQLVTRDDMYQSPEAIRAILRDRATRDHETNRPLLYLSSDAHALKKFVDDTWAAKWKMTNGIRLWCEDKKTGRVIHLGGEFTWGDCQAVRAIFEDLIARGILMADGNYGDDLHVQLVWLSDGMPWFKDHIHSLFKDIVVILDVYHLLQTFAAFIALCVKPKSKKARRWMAQVKEMTVGPRPKRETAKIRLGHKKNVEQKISPHAHQRDVDRRINPVNHAIKFIWMLFDVPKLSKKAEAAQQRLFSFLYNDLDRINYIAFRARGYQIGSGAMESLHRSGSQHRLKLPGAKWLEETSQSIFNIRMMRLAGNWANFWAQPDLEKRFANVQSA
jgi:hypothetical protein